MTPRAPAASTQTLSAAEARRLTLGAQGFCDRPHARPTMRTLQRTLDRVGVAQVDSVSVLRRAHYMPFYSRMGPYDPGLLHRAAEQRPRRVVEYFAHVQALMPVGLWPVMRHRMRHYAERRGKWGVRVEDTALVDRVLAAVTERGPVTAAELDEGEERRREHWGWNWSTARQVLDYLFMAGELAVAGRGPGFEVCYDLPERVLPPEVLAAPTPAPEEAHRELVRRAARAHGVGTLRCLADYYRMPVADARRAAADLVAAGELEPVRVEGLGEAYRDTRARVPREVGARTVLSPFDPVCWERRRVERLFGFHYRIEIYVPRHRRRYGYYVLPFLLGDRLVARVDLKADRATGRLLVPGAYAEPRAPTTTAEELAAELRRLAGWLGLGEVSPGPHGDLTPGLRSALQ